MKIYFVFTGFVLTGEVPNVGQCLKLGHLKTQARFSSNPNDNINFEKVMTHFVYPKNMSK